MGMVAAPCWPAIMAATADVADVADGGRDGGGFPAAAGRAPKKKASLSFIYLGRTIFETLLLLFSSSLAVVTKKAAAHTRRRF